MQRVMYTADVLRQTKMSGQTFMSVLFLTKVRFLSIHAVSWLILTHILNIILQFLWNKTGKWSFLMTLNGALAGMVIIIIVVVVGIIVFIIISIIAKFSFED